MITKIIGGKTMSAHEKVEMSPNGQNMCCHDAFSMSVGGSVTENKGTIEAITKTKSR